MSDVTHPSRRERGKRDKDRRIRAAAADLFARDGYAAVTTHAIAEAADVGTGTLFRYFPTKADLLVAVMNELLDRGIDQGLAAARDGATAVDAILLAVDPLVRSAVAQPENTAVYQREALFGEDLPRDSVSARTAQLRDAIRRILEPSAGPTPAAADLERAADAIFATMYLQLARTTTGPDDPATLPARLRDTVTYLVNALLPAGPPAP